MQKQSGIRLSFSSDKLSRQDMFSLFRACNRDQLRAMAKQNKVKRGRNKRDTARNLAAFYTHVKGTDFVIYTGMR